MDPITLSGRQKLVTLFGAEMRHVDDRSGIVGLDPEHSPGFHGFQPFRGLQNRKWTQKPGRIEFVVNVDIFRHKCER